jgi:hypothetical protein
MGNIFDCRSSDGQILQKLDELAELNNKLAAQNFELNNKLAAQNSELNKKFAAMENKIENNNKILSKMLFDKNYHDINPWLEMSTTDRSRVTNLRRKLFNALAVSDLTAACWLTGITGKVKVAHIIPNSSRAGVLSRLGLSSEFKNSLDLSRPLNLMVLNSAVEEAFDKLQLSFVPQDILNPNSFFLKIWDDSIRNSWIGNDFDNKPLKVPAGVMLSRRALSFQAYMAYLHNRLQNPSPDMPMDRPEDFSSEYEGKDSFRQYLITLLKTSVREEMDLAVDDYTDSS